MRRNFDSRSMTFWVAAGAIAVLAGCSNSPKQLRQAGREDASECASGSTDAEGSCQGASLVAPMPSPPSGVVTLGPDYKAMVCAEIASQIQLMTTSPCGQAPAPSTCGQTTGMSPGSSASVRCAPTDMVCVDAMIAQEQQRQLSLNDCREDQRVREQSCAVREEQRLSLCQSFAKGTCPGGILPGCKEAGL